MSSVKGIDAVKLKALLAKKRKPKTILGNRSVRGWLGSAGQVNEYFPKRIKFAILQISAGSAPKDAQLVKLRVSEATWPTSS